MKSRNELLSGMSYLMVTTIQADLVWEDKKANLQQFEEKIRGIPGKKELVILPEMFSTGFSMSPAKLAEPMTGESVSWMRRVAAENHIILTGSLIIEDEGLYYNRLIWMLPTGDYGYYDKRHLFGYAGEHEVYTPGNRRLIASVKGWRINLQICYDLRFPIWSRQQPGTEIPEYDLLVYVANWPERRIHAWKTLLQARAIENQCYVVGVNRVGNDGHGIYHSGNTMVLGPMGDTLYHGQQQPETHSVQLELDQLNEVRAKLPFLKDGDAFTLLNLPV